MAHVSAAERARRRQLIVRLHDIHNRSLSAVARDLKCPVSTVRRMYFEGRSASGEREHPLTDLPPRVRFALLRAFGPTVHNAADVARLLPTLQRAADAAPDDQLYPRGDRIRGIDTDAVSEIEEWLAVCADCDTDARGS